MKGTMFGCRRHRHMMSSWRYAYDASTFSASLEGRISSTHPLNIIDLVSMQPQSFHGYPSSLQYNAPDIRERSLRERSSRLCEHR
jgi:hypothetical protein